jgi:hypothetical protein
MIVVSCCSVSVLLVWSRAAVPCTRARVHALMRKQAKRREEEGTHVAVSCFSVLVCWHRPCIASYSVDAQTRTKMLVHKKITASAGAGGGAPRTPRYRKSAIPFIFARSFATQGEFDPL